MFNSYRLCAWAVVARALARFTIIGAQEERRCTRRASMHLAHLRAPGGLLCSWKNSMHLGNSDAPGDRFQPKKQSLGASKLEKCTEDSGVRRGSATGKWIDDPEAHRSSSPWQVHRSSSH